MSDEFLPPRKRVTYSPTWNYFKRLSSSVAKCVICNKKFSFKTTITNLKRHLHLKHQLNLNKVKSKAPKTFTVLDDEVNVRKLIHFVKQKPCLWDERSADFKNSEEQFKAWKGIASALCPEIDAGVAVDRLTEVFSFLRKCFEEDLIILAKGSMIEPSAYHTDLKFLTAPSDVINVLSSSESSLQEEPVEMDVFEIHEINVKNEPLDETYNEKDLNPILEEDASHVDSDHKDCEEQTSWKNETKSRHKESRESKTKEEKKTQSGYSLQLYNADKDVLFLLSLTEEMTRVPKELKTSFKAELITAISRLVQKYSRLNDADFEE